MTALMWLVAAILLVIAEMFVGDLVLLMLGGGALAAAGVDLVFDPPLWVDAVTFAVV
ncbi:NfeD family protein, partial [Streptomyces sp. SID10244]|nr:NfeD family protein [Streptomyces sp. SID10244]